jgi:hypothetical protein
LIAIWFWLCFLLLNVLNQAPPRPTHSMPLVPIIAIVTALALFVIGTFVTRFVSSRLAWGTVGAIVLAIVLLGLRQYFIIAQDQIRPELESLMTWTELDAKSPTNVVYLYQGNPDHYLFAPWAIEHFDTRATFELLPLNELLAKQAEFEAPGQQYYFYAAPEIADDALGLLSSIYSTGQTQKYWAYDGRFIGVSYRVDRE